MDLSWISALAPWLLTRETALLLVGGFVVGIFSVIIGGGFFISIPLLQFLFPSVSYGAIVGNLKVGSFFRGIGSTITNRKEIDWLGNLLWSVPLVIGTVLGVMVIVLLGGACFSTFSLIIACLVRTRERFMGIGQVLTMPLFFASNAIYPIVIMPAWLQAIARANPLSYEVDALRSLMLANNTNFAGLIPDFTVMFCITTVLVLIGARLYPRLAQ